MTKRKTAADAPPEGEQLPMVEPEAETASEAAPEAKTAAEAAPEAVSPAKAPPEATERVYDPLEVVQVRFTGEMGILGGRVVHHGEVHAVRYWQYLQARQTGGEAYRLVED